VVLDYARALLLGRLLRSAAALGSTSAREGFGLPLLEATAAGTPMVAVAAPYVREVCDTLLSWPKRGPDALADALHRVMSNSVLWLRNCA
jgi:glycosyltransferase involved in cell wall biosynthesis